MQIIIDVYDAAGTLQGTVGNVVRASVTRALDGAGSWSATVPARDDTARRLLVNEARIRLRVDQYGAGLREVARGIVREVQYEAGTEGYSLAVGGPDNLDELKRINVKFDREYDDVSVAEIVADLVGLVPGWSSVCEITQTYTGRFDGVTVLKALQSLAEYQGAHLRLYPDEPGNVLEFGFFGEERGPRLVNSEGVANLGDGVELISNLRKTSHTAAVANRLFALGAGENVDAAIDLDGTTRTDPPVQSVEANGRTLYYIEDAASIQQYGLIEHIGQFTEIGPIENVDALTVRAKDALHDAAAAWLERHAVEQTQYSVNVPGTRVSLSPGDRVRVDYIDQVAQGSREIEILRVDEALWCMRLTEQFGASGSNMGLELSNTDRHATSSARVVVGALEQIRLQGMTVRPSFNHYTYGPEQVQVDGSTPGTVQLIVNDKTYQIEAVTLRVRTRPFVSNITGSAAGGDHRHLVAELSGLGNLGANLTNDYYGYNFAALEEMPDTPTSEDLALIFVRSLSSEGYPRDLYTYDASGDHTHDPVYGIFEDDQRPAGMTITVNGETVATGLGEDDADLDETIDITDEVRDKAGGFRAVHDVVITPSSGRGEVLVTFDVYELITPFRAG